jgi:tRNA(fMet)-specific endonuclease VapC
MPFLLDTDTCIYLINRRPGYEGALRHMDGLEYGDVLISAVTLAELHFGVAKSARRETNSVRLEHFLARFETLIFGEEAAGAYGPLRAHLESEGTPIGPLDTLLAAQALAAGCTLVTNNSGEFSRVPGLRTENWFGAEMGGPGHPRSAST